jgi:hypothetical protein
LKRIERAFYDVFSGESGKIVLEYLARSTNADEDNFNRESERLNCYNQGRRSVIIEIRKLTERGKNGLFNQKQ